MERGTSEKNNCTSEKKVIIHRLMLEVPHDFVVLVREFPHEMEQKMKYNYIVTPEGIETDQDVRKIKSGDSAGRRQMVTNAANFNKLVRYAQMMDELHIACSRARRGIGPGAVINKTQNHTVLFIAIIRIYQAVGRAIAINQTYLAERYGMDRGTVKTILEDFFRDGFLDANYFPTDLLMEKYNEFVEHFCAAPETENFSRSIAFGLMQRAAPDQPEYEELLKTSAGKPAP